MEYIPSYIAEKYIRLVGNKLDRFHQPKPSIWVFRCPLCGDSKRHPWKTRGYFFEKSGGYFFKCHNCGRSDSLSSFLNLVEPRLYSEFWLEIFQNREKPKEAPAPLMAQFYHRNEVLEYCTRLDKLPADHPTFLYAKKRMLPDRAYQIFYSVDNWAEFVASFDSDAAKKAPEDLRLVIPVFDSEGILVKAQGRAVLPESKTRYASATITANRAALFGEDRLVAGKTIFGFEGPIDSVFVENGIAFTTLTSTNVRWTPDQLTIVTDNQPRNRDVVNVARRWLVREYPVVIWPTGMLAKDVNEAVMIGEIKTSEVERFLQENACKGPTGLLKLEQWKRI